MIDLNVGNTKIGELSSDSDQSSESEDISDEEVKQLIEEQRPKTVWDDLNEGLKVKYLTGLVKDNEVTQQVQSIFASDSFKGRRKSLYELSKDDKQKAEEVARTAELLGARRSLVVQ